MTNKKVLNLTVKIFADGADLDSICVLNHHPLVMGFTTNPTLMRKAGVADYEGFARKVLETITEKPISFEVFADDLDTMCQQALTIAAWGKNVNVKIPVTNTKGEFTGPILSKLARQGVCLNVTALMTNDQVRAVAKVLDPAVPAIVSVFAGRIADTGLDPAPAMQEAVEILRPLPEAQLLWASPREVLNIFQADAIGCDIITVTPDLLKKLELTNKDLNQFSLETVAMFHRDALSAGYRIDVTQSMEMLKN